MRSKRKLTNKLVALARKLLSSGTKPKTRRKTKEQAKTEDVVRKVNFVVSCVYVTAKEKKNC